MPGACTLCPMNNSISILAGKTEAGVIVWRPDSVDGKSGMGRGDPDRTAAAGAERNAMGSMPCSRQVRKIRQESSLGDLLAAGLKARRSLPTITRPDSVWPATWFIRRSRSNACAIARKPARSSTRAGDAAAAAMPRPPRPEFFRRLTSRPLCAPTCRIRHSSCSGTMAPFPTRARFLLPRRHGHPRLRPQRGGCGRTLPTAARRWRASTGVRGHG